MAPRSTKHADVVLFGESGGLDQGGMAMPALLAANWVKYLRELANARRVRLDYIGASRADNVLRAQDIRYALSTIDHLPNELNAVAIFVKVAEHKSFTVAAKKLGITTSGASKAVNRLEARLGVQLAQRTTRSIKLTPEGALYAERCRQLLNELEEASHAVTSAQTEPSGKLRIQIPAAEGRAIIVPALSRFLDEYPKLTLDLELVGLGFAVQEGVVDCAVLIGTLPDARIVARKICVLRYVICASPDYLGRYGTPATLDELRHHRGLVYLNPLTGRPADWQVLIDDKITNVPIRPSLTTDGIQTLVDAAVGGAGVTLAPTAVVSKHVSSGALRVVLPGLSIPTQTMSVVYLHSRRLSPRISAFTKFLTKLIPADPPWDRVFRDGTANQGK
jgi:LysR family transcriptional regulator, regulator for bpeEF and oprC